MKYVRVLAHASSANLGPGFDAVAVALEEFYDIVEAKLEYGSSGVWIDRVEGPYAESVSLSRNTAKAAVSKLLELAGIGEAAISLRIYKGIPPGRGLGSSGASAVAAVVAAARLLGIGLDPRILLEASGYGESVVAGTPHYDNVAASLLGGLAVVATIGGRVEAASIPVDAWFVVAVPQIEVPEGKTGIMRKVLPSSIQLQRATTNWQRLALMITAMSRRDYRLAGKMMLGDEIIEPARAPYVPCYREVRMAALEAGAYGVAISGAGPSIIALVEDRALGESVAREMHRAYGECGVEVLVKVTGTGGPARQLT